MNQPCARSGGLLPVCHSQGWCDLGRFLLLLSLITSLLSTCPALLPPLFQLAPFTRIQLLSGLARVLLLLYLYP